MSVISMQRLNKFYENCCSYRLQKLGILSVFRTDGQTEKAILGPVPAAGNAYSSFNLHLNI
jgi:hypothetical protein